MGFRNDLYNKEDDFTSLNPYVGNPMRGSVETNMVYQTALQHAEERKKRDLQVDPAKKEDLLFVYHTLRKRAKSLCGKCRMVVNEYRISYVEMEVELFSSYRTPDRQDLLLALEKSDVFLFTVTKQNTLLLYCEVDIFYPEDPLEP